MVPPLIDYRREILRLKKERNALILAHNYQRPEIQDISDFVGDSLGLSYKAKETDASVIAFCGVHFMAETAKIVNPDKCVILPDMEAGCSLADCCPSVDLEVFLQQNVEKNYYVIAYINCSMGVKALADVIVTSGNAVAIVNQAPLERPILFVPDRNLGSWVSQQTKRPMDLWNGACHVHVEFSAQALMTLKKNHPDSIIVAHPECMEPVRLLADEVCSTEKMIAVCREAEARDIIVVTEVGMLHRLAKEVPEKNFIPAGTETCSCNECPFMKINTLKKLYYALDTLSPQIELDESVRLRAEKPLLRMLEQSR